MSIDLINNGQAPYAACFVYLAELNEIRMLVQSKGKSFTVISLYANKVAGEIVSESSKGEKCSIGCSFEDGLSFLENLLAAIREDSSSLTQQDQILFI